MEKISKNRLILILGVAVLAFLMMPGGDEEEEFSSYSTVRPGKARKKAKLAELKAAAYDKSKSVKLRPLPEKIADPFKSRSISTVSRGKMKLKRALRFKGIVSGNGKMSAVILDHTGASHLVRTGQSINGTTVISVEREKVLLKDAYGRFWLNQK